MDENAFIAVIGDSLLMDGVASSLRFQPAVNIIRMDHFGADTAEHLKSLEPAVVIFEMDAPRPCAILTLLKEQPGILLLGIDTNCSLVTVFHSSRHSIDNIKELHHLVQAKISREARNNKGGKELDKIDNHCLSV